MTRATLGTGSTMRRRALAGAAALVLVLGACGGDDDDDTDGSEVTSTTVPGAGGGTTVTSTTAAPTVTSTTSTTMPALVTEGATVVVANASTVDGAAGRMSERLAAAGFTMGEATTSVEDLETSKVYYNDSVEGAEAVANSLVQLLGGGDITTAVIGVPAPVESGEIDGEVLVAMGNDVADLTLEEIASGGGGSDDTDPDSSDPDSSDPDSTESEATDPEASDESTPTDG